jgi:hypothetical protein
MYADAKEQQARGRNEKTTSNTAIDPGEFPEYTEKVAKRLTTVLKDLPSDSVLKDLPSDSPLRKYYQEMASQLDEMARRYGSSLRPERVSPGGNGEPTLQVERPLVEEIRNSMTAGNMTLAAQA